MVYVKKIQVNSYEEWLKMAINQKFTISQTIVESILDNIDTKRTKLPIFEIEVESKGDIYTLSVETDQFISTLETNLLHFENEEAYESCGKIIEAINYLKNKKSNEKN